LNYCNRCGANLNQPANQAEADMRPVNLTAPTIAICLMVVIALAIIFVGATELLARGINPTALTWMVIVSLAMVMGVSSLFIRQWTTLAGLAQPKERKKPAETKPSALAPPAQLPPMRSEPVPSVTDHTTRTFDPVKARKL
jgi:hypothetical protein